MLRPDYPIKTRRLILRPFTEFDLEDLYAIQSLPEVARYLYWEPRDREQVRQALLSMVRGWALMTEGDVLALAVVLPSAGLPSAGTVIGDVILKWSSVQHRQGEIGYVFHPGHGGHGFATEAATALLRLGFDDLRLHRIIGRIDGRNTASARVLERLGMRREAHFIQNEIVKGEWTDEVVYALTEDEWRGASVMP
ncbi:MAG TPA: GNAT family N-acetyltransferase [Streptosporangiaceae bacterium]